MSLIKVLHFSRWTGRIKDTADFGVGPLQCVEVELEDSLENLRGLVGGNIELVANFGRREIWANEKGARSSTNYITEYLGVFVYGPFFVARRGLSSLTDYDLMFLKAVHAVNAA